MATTETDHRFWDCECAKYYIHAKIKKEENCSSCGAHADEQPDSQVSEIKEDAMKFILRTRFYCGKSFETARKIYIGMK